MAKTKPDPSPVAGFDRVYMAKDAPKIAGPGDAAAVISGLGMADLDVEYMLALALDVRHRVRRVFVVGQGTVDACLVCPAVVFRGALAVPRCKAIILAHNHPSGETVPSGDDLALTRRVAQGAQLLGLQLLDHIIVGDGVLSLRESQPDAFNDGGRIC